MPLQRVIPASGLRPMPSRAGNSHHALALHDTEAVGHKCQISETGIAGGVQARDVKVGIGGRKINRHPHQIAGHRSACVRGKRSLRGPGTARSQNTHGR